MNQNLVGSIYGSSSITSAHLDSCWEKGDEKCAYMFNVYKNQQSRHTGSRNLTGPKMLPTIWHTYMKRVTIYRRLSWFLYTLNIYAHFFRRIFLSNYWWQKSDIWSQASYRYPISREAFLDPSNSYFLFADFVDFYTHWTYMRIFRRIFLSTEGRTDRRTEVKQYTTSPFGERGYNNFIVQPHTYNGFDKCIHKHY
jgi:hypothetical protein